MSFLRKATTTTTTTPKNDNDYKMVVKCCLAWKTMTTVCNYVILVCFYRSIVVEPLAQDALLMANKDPTDIISVPFPIGQLRLYVTLSVLSTFGFCVIYMTKATSIIFRVWGGGVGGTRQKSMLQHVYELSVHVLAGALLLFFVALLSGASPWILEHVEHTFWGVLYMSAIALGPSFCPIAIRTEHHARNESSWDVSCGDGVGGIGGEQNVQQQQQPRYYNYYIEWINQSILSCTIIITVPFMILLILDWGIQSQRWPVPIILGNTIGHGLGMVIGILLGWGDWFFFRGRPRQTMMTTADIGDESKYS
mmetsp:Transcript_12330/g.17005  ORF Transcript_12330/g.17005 Transcript_12330/m.17005 type:complete len:308 (-) Transcript_12330:45-968(-)